MTSLRYSPGLFVLTAALAGAGVGCEDGMGMEQPPRCQAILAGQPPVEIAILEDICDRYMPDPMEERVNPKVLIIATDLLCKIDETRNICTQTAEIDLATVCNGREVNLAIDPALMEVITDTLFAFSRVGLNAIDITTCQRMPDGEFCSTFCTD